MDVRLEQQLQRVNNTYTPSETGPLTVAQVLKYEVIVVGNMAITLPAAGAALEGVSLRFLSTHANADVIGFAADGTSTFDVAEGEMLIAYCNGTYWYACNVTTHS